MSERHDDIIDLIERAEKARTGRRAKVLQEWKGRVAAHVRNGADLAGSLRDEADKKNARWSFSNIAFSDNWVAFDGYYRAKGANANDAEKLIHRLAGEVYEVAVDTVGTTVIPQA